MTNTEFSDSFDVLLNSYNTKAEFGDQASKREIVLDEYEKSVLLTQAQDIIVKSYFDRNLNSEGKGFDDGTKRQVDFSSLIKVEELKPLSPTITSNTITKEWNDGNGYLGRVKVTNISGAPLRIQIGETTGQTDHGVDIRYIASNGNSPAELLILCDPEEFTHAGWGPEANLSVFFQTVIDVFNTDITPHLSSLVIIRVEDFVDEDIDTDDYLVFDDVLDATTTYREMINFDERGVIFTLPYKEVKGKAISNVLFILNEKLIVDGKNYVIVPINYQEYDRKMSKPYGQPLKRQAWRLIQNVSTGFDIHSELIPKWNIDISDATYRIRYVRRPRPIVLENFENLDIDGESTETSCELNPILHNEILQKAFEIAVQTRGGGSAVQPERQERRG